MLTAHYRGKRLFIALLALMGVGIMGYLTYLHYANVRSFCDISESVSCDIVTTSLYSEIFGVPISVFGLLYFAAVLFAVIRKPALRTYTLIFFGTAFVLMPSLYLTLTEFVFIQSFCILCETSKVLMVGIFAASFLEIRKHSRNLLRKIIPIIIAGIVAAGIMYFMQTGTIVPRDNSGLVSHLNEQGWIYYRSYTCSNCKRQEKLLGEAYKSLHFVECHPRGPSGNPELCLQKNITKTPTWILEQNGKETMRLEGLQTIDELIRISNYVQ